MKHKVFLFICAILVGISIVWITPTVRAEDVVKGELRHTEFPVVTVPIPRCLPQPLLVIIFKVVGRVWPEERFKDPVFLQRAGNAYYDAQFAMLPWTLFKLMTFANKDTEKNPSTVAGRICVYVDGQLDPISDQLLSDTRFQTASTDPYSIIELRSSLGPFAAYAPLYSITRQELDRTKATQVVDVENQLACDVASPRDTKHDYDDPREGENKFIPGFAKAIYNMLQEICSICPPGCCPCKDNELYYKGTGLDAWEGFTLALAGTTTDPRVKSYLDMVNYPIPEKEKKAGKITSEMAASLEILHSDELPTGGSDIQPMCGELFGCVYEPASSRYAQSFLIYGTIADYCAKMPASLAPTYFNNLLDDDPSTSADESKNACLRNYLKLVLTQMLAETEGNKSPKDAAGQETLDLSTITPASNAPMGTCAGNMPATAGAFITYLREHNILWPNYDNISAHYNEIIAASKKAGIDPGITMATYIEESGAGRAGPAFGCTKIANDFTSQLRCFVNLWNTYSTDSRFTECRGSDGKLDMREFMLTYSGGYLDCRSGKFDRVPDFPQKIKDWYDKVTNCSNGLQF